MKKFPTAWLALIAAALISACGGGGSDGGSTQAAGTGPSTETPPGSGGAGTGSSGNVDVYVGAWRQKSVCVAETTPARNSFTQDKYVSIVATVSKNSDGSLAFAYNSLWFKNPACVGIGERDPNEDPQATRTSCSKRLGSENREGRIYDVVVSCSESSSTPLTSSLTTLFRVINDDLEMTNEGRSASPVNLVYMKYL